MDQRKKNRIGTWLMIGVVGCMVGCSQEQGGFGLSSRSSGERGGWHIVVKRFYGPGQDQMAGMVYESLRRVPQLDASKIRKATSSDYTMVTYGRYSGPEASSAQNDMHFIKSLAIPDQGFPFLDAHLSPIPEPDPPIRSEWVLANTDGYWTLQIAQFHDQNRKLAAVQLVDELRKDEVPAFVYHGPVKSYVTIGSYDESAVRSPTGRQIAQTLTPADPELRRWRAEYPYMIINTGYARMRTLQGQKQSGLLQSQIIKIPRPGESLW